MANRNGMGTRVEVLELALNGVPAKPPCRLCGDMEPAPTQDGAYTWVPSGVTWAKAALTNKRNVFSVHGIGAAGVSFILRRYPLTLNSAIRWQGQHCFITSILPADYGHLTVEAALVVLSQCRNPYTGETFPAVMTERYVGYQQLEPMAVNIHQRVLVTPKAVRLDPGPLVEVDGVAWPIATPYELDPHKNEYVLQRTVDL